MSQRGTSRYSHRMTLEQQLRDGAWSTEPVSATLDGGSLRVEAHAKSDAWQTTSYGFVRDDAHALLTPFGEREAIEVSFVLDYDQAYDQAGIMIRVDAQNWIKAGVEISDGAPQVGAVVTRGKSDWSTAPVPEWIGREVTIRASRDGDAVTVRARVENEPWRLVRLAPLDPGATAQAGLYCCAPSRAGLVVTFTGHRRGAPDLSLH